MLCYIPHIGQVAKLVDARGLGPRSERSWRFESSPAHSVYNESMLEFLAQNILLFYGIAFITSVLSASIGVGSFVLIPLAAIVYGPKEAVGIITLYFLFQNVNKIVVFRDHIDWKIAWKMIAWSIPGAIIGAMALSFLSPVLFTKILALFIILYLINDIFTLVPKKHYGMALIPGFGLLYGFLSGLIGSGNLVKGPLFTSIGLLKERYIGTYAVTSFFVNVPKILVYVGAGVIVGSTFIEAVPFLLISIAGTFIGKRFVAHISNDVYYYLMNIIFALSAIALLFDVSL